MDKKYDLTGQTFNMLTVIKRVENDKHGNAMWLCECSCQEHNRIITRGSSLRDGNTKSCGCLQKEKAKKNAKNIGKQNKKNNPTIIKNGYCISTLSNGDCFYYDIDDYEKVNKYYWNVSPQGYIVTVVNNNEKYNTIILSRLIMNPSDNEVVDHKNHNKYDNRKDNLRICNQIDNAKNRSISKNNTSGYTGVTYNIGCKKWLAFIYVNKQRIHLGVYDNKDNAIKARKEAEKKYFGEYSYDESLKDDNNIINESLTN